LDSVVARGGGESVHVDRPRRRQYGWVTTSGKKPDNRGISAQLLIYSIKNSFSGTYRAHLKNTGPIPDLGPGRERLPEVAGKWLGLEGK